MRSAAELRGSRAGHPERKQKDLSYSQSAFRNRKMIGEAKALLRTNRSLESVRPHARSLAVCAARDDSA